MKLDRKQNSGPLQATLTLPLLLLLSPWTCQQQHGLFAGALRLKPHHRQPLSFNHELNLLSDSRSKIKRRSANGHDYSFRARKVLFGVRGGSDVVAKKDTDTNLVVNSDSNAAGSQSTSVASVSTVLSYNQTSAQIGSTELSTLLTQLQVPLDSSASAAPKGLTTEQALVRQKQYGKNTLDSPPGRSLLSLILEQFDDKLVQILLAVAGISGIFSFMEVKQHMSTVQSKITFKDALKGFMEPLIILTILVLNAAVGVWQSQQAEGSLLALQSLQPSLATVLRDSQWVEINAAELVPGDVIRIRVGDKVSADARVLSLESSVLSLDEGSLTGESVTVGKVPGDEGLCKVGDPVQDMRGVIFAGTVCTAGSAIAVVSGLLGCFAGFLFMEVEWSNRIFSWIIW